MKVDGIVENKTEQDRSLESGIEISAEERHKPTYPKPSVNAIASAYCFIRVHCDYKGERSTRPLQDCLKARLQKKVVASSLEGN